MENLKWKETPSDRAKDHVLFHHGQADGWITLARKEKSGAWQQYHYKEAQLEAELAKRIGEDVYFSQNTFYKPKRRIENIRQLRALYVDVDCYVLNYDPEWVVGKTDLEIFKDVLPEPNLVIFSGRGIVYVWLIEPAPHQALPLWQALQNYFCEQLKYVGADEKSTDATRVFRIAGSVNSKSDNEVAVQYRHEYRYSLRDLQGDYLPDLAPSKPKKPGRKSKIRYLHNVRSLHHARLLDLVRLLDLRDGDVKGNREMLCFLYRYWSCCLTDDATDSLGKMLEFNSEFKEPLPEREVIRATASAEKAWNAKSDDKANEEAVSKGYPGAGYNLKNTTVIQWLDITGEEQKHLRTIIDGNEKRRRKRERDKLASREKHGSVSREEYLEQQNKKKEDTVSLLKEAIQSYPALSNRKLATLFKISESYVRKLKQTLHT